MGAHWRLSETQFWAGCHAELSQEVLQSGGGIAGLVTPSRLTQGGCLAPARPALVPRLRLPPSPHPEITSLVPHRKEFPVQPQRQLTFLQLDVRRKISVSISRRRHGLAAPGPGTPALAWLPLERRYGAVSISWARDP